MFIVFVDNFFSIMELIDWFCFKGWFWKEYNIEHKRILLRQYIFLFYYCISTGLISEIYLSKLYALLINDVSITLVNNKINVPNLALVYGIKFFISILFLIFIRAGIPRYRYDFLTFLGWVRFLLISVLFLLALFILYFI